MTTFGVPWMVVAGPERTRLPPVNRPFDATNTPPA